jgi:hypothetical protein
MTTKQLVLKEFIDAFYGKRYQYDQENWISGGWIPCNKIANINGISGLRRLRDLRAAGIKFEKPRKYIMINPVTGDKKKTKTVIYKMLTHPDKIDREDCCLKKVSFYQPELDPLPLFS